VACLGSGPFHHRAAVTPRDGRRTIARGALCTESGRQADSVGSKSADFRQFRVLVTCIFLNKTEAVRARPFLEAFLEEYPTPERLRGADASAIGRTYFKRLGLNRRADWLVRMAEQLIQDPPRPGVFRRKSYQNSGYACEVAHLAGVGAYASDAWRLFCRRAFYARHGISVADEWRTLDPEDKDLKRYVRRKRREEQTRLLADDITSRMAAVQLSNASAPRPRSPRRSGVRAGAGDNAFHVPQRLLDQATDISVASSGIARATRSNRAVASAS